MGARLIGLDLCVLLHAARSMEALLSSPPPPASRWAGAAGAPYHLLCYSWGCPTPPSGKAKRRCLDGLAASALPAGLGCGRRVGGLGLAR